MNNNASEGGLQAPTRHTIDWKSLRYTDEDDLFAELERVFDICHGCRRCVSLCKSFPVLFDLVDESDTFEVDGIAKSDYWQVVEQCYLCDLCYMVKCPYVPPHEWDVDFPHLMLRAKAFKHQNEGTSIRNKILSNTDMVGGLASLPAVSKVVNIVNASDIGRSFLEKTLRIDKQAVVPQYHNQTLRKKLSVHDSSNVIKPVASKTTTGKVAIFATCYGNYNEPQIGEDLLKVFEHNQIAVKLVGEEKCCGMPKLELGDLAAVEKAKELNAPVLLSLIEEGWDIVTPMPSCVLMFKQELPLLFAEDARLAKIKQHIFDPFEYLVLRHQAGLFNVDFTQTLGKVSYHVACHQRVQNIGPKTQEILQLVPDTQVTPIERCSGHDGTYGLKTEFHAHSRKIARPVLNKVKQTKPDYFGSDCAMAGHHIAHILNEDKEYTGEIKSHHPLSLLCIAYGLE